MMALIKNQNTYVHKVHSILFINLGSLEGKFYAVYVKIKAKKRKHDDGAQEKENATSDEEMDDSKDKIGSSSEDESEDS